MADGDDGYPTWRRFVWGVRHLFSSTEEILDDAKNTITKVERKLAYDIKTAESQAEWTLEAARAHVRNHNPKAAEELLHGYAQELVGLKRQRDLANRLRQRKITLTVTTSQVTMMRIDESMAFALDKWSDKDSLESRLQVLDKLQEDLAETREMLDTADQTLETHAHVSETTEAAVYANNPIDATVSQMLGQLEKDEADRLLADAPKVITQKRPFVKKPVAARK